MALVMARRRITRAQELDQLLCDRGHPPKRDLDPDSQEVVALFSKGHRAFIGQLARRGWVVMFPRDALADAELRADTVDALLAAAGVPADASRDAGRGADLPSLLETVHKEAMAAKVDVDLLSLPSDDETDIIAAVPTKLIAVFRERKLVRWEEVESSSALIDIGQQMGLSRAEAERLADGRLTWWERFVFWVMDLFDPPAKP